MPPNAFASSVLNTATVDGFAGDDPQTTNTYARLLNSGAAADPTRVNGIDGVVVFTPGGATIDTERVTQLSNGEYSIEGIAIEELGHILGFTSGNDPFTGQVAEGPSPFDGTLNINLFVGDAVVEVDTLDALDVNNAGLLTASIDATTNADFMNTGIASVGTLTATDDLALDNDGTFVATSFTAADDAEFDLDGTTTIGTVTVGDDADFLVDAGSTRTTAGAVSSAPTGTRRG